MSKSKYLEYKLIKKRARELRSSSTESEKLLWKELRNRMLSGYKFLRQHPVIYKADKKGLKYFIADFYCGQKNTVIELDGPIHNSTVEYDSFRDDEMAFREIHVLRIKNEELTDMKKTLQTILDFFNNIS